MRITSSQNPTIKYVRSLDRTSVRREEGVLLAEGVRLVGEAMATSQFAVLVLYDPDSLQRTTAGSHLLHQIPGWAERSYEADQRVLSAAAQTETPGGVVAVLRTPAVRSLTVHTTARFGLILDGLGDPGNVGTILRTADAFGASYVVALQGCVDLFSPKVVRAGMGAHFRLPLYQDVRIADVQAALPSATLVASAVGEGKALSRFPWPLYTGLVIGSEAHGLAADVEDLVEMRVHIPIRRGVESLNAGVAASIVMYAALGESFNLDET